MASSAQAGRADEPFGVLDDSPRFMLYVHKEIGSTRHKSTGPSFGFAVDRPIPLTLQMDQSALRPSTARIFDFRVAPFDDGAILLNGFRLTGGASQGLGFDSYGGPSWSNPWVMVAAWRWRCGRHLVRDGQLAVRQRLRRQRLLGPAMNSRVVLACAPGDVERLRHAAARRRQRARTGGARSRRITSTSHEHSSRALVVALAAAWLSGCATTLAAAAYRTFDAESASAGELDFHGLPLQSGQLVVSDSGDPDSLLMSMLGEQYTPYGHAGILSIEDGKAYVYEGYALLWPFLSGPPTDAMRGRIRRVTLDQYIGRQRVTAIFDPPAGVDKAAVAAFARARHEDGTEFDPYFDWRDHTRLYCTEFAALALHAGGRPLPTPVRVRDNASLRVALDWLKVRAPAIVTAGSLTEGAERVALISRRLTAREVEAYFAAKRELHRRFTDDQKLGNIWSWSWRGLQLRPQVEAFLEASSLWPHETAADLADDWLGAFAADRWGKLETGR